MMNSDSEFQKLTSKLQQWNGRRRLRDGLIWVPRSMLAGLLIAVLIATFARLRPVLHNDDVGYIAIGLALAGVLISVTFLLSKRYSLLQQGRFADQQFQLKERITTAIEIQSGRILTSPSLARLQLADTLGAINPIDTKTSLPLRINRRDWMMILLAIILLVIAIILPNPQGQALKKRQAIAQSIEDQIEALEALEEEIIQNPELTEEQRDELLEPLETAIEGLNNGEISQEGAVATLSEAEADLRTLEENYNTENLRQSLQDAGQPLTENNASQTLGEALQNGALSESAAATAQLADDLPQLTAEELAALAKDLSATAEALEGVDSELAQELADAAQALANGDVSAAQQALREASGTFQQRAQETAAAQQAQTAAGQLNQGRQEVAQADQTDQQNQGQGQGQGQSQGQGQGQDQGSGSGDGQGQGTGQGQQTDQGQGTGGPGPGGGHAESVFVPDFIDLSGEPGVEIELPAECLANPANCGGLLTENPTEFTNEGSTVPYNQVFGDYRNSAYEALSDDYIPLGLKGYVRDYFSSLEP